MTEEVICAWCGELRKPSHYCKERNKIKYYLIGALLFALFLGLAIGFFINNEFERVSENGERCIINPLKYAEEAYSKEYPLTCGCSKKSEGFQLPFYR